jgi:hypothetical protein
MYLGRWLFSGTHMDKGKEEGQKGVCGEYERKPW